MLGLTLMLCSGIFYVTGRYFMRRSIVAVQVGTHGSNDVGNVSRIRVQENPPEKSRFVSLRRRASVDDYAIYPDQFVRAARGSIHFVGKLRGAFYPTFGWLIRCDQRIAQVQAVFWEIFRLRFFTHTGRVEQSSASDVTQNVRWRDTKIAQIYTKANAMHYLCASTIVGETEALNPSDQQEWTVYVKRRIGGYMQVLRYADH